MVAPTDHLIIREDVFLDDVKKGLAFVKEHDALVTLGIKPSRPETGYGYIQSSEQMCGEFTKVKTFTEKPNLEMAKVFVQSGEFFWNSGLFLWNVNSILKAYEKYMPDITLRFNMGLDKFNTPAERDFINEQYPYCRNISVDYGIMEKADNVYMLCVDFGWADVGTWGSLYDMTPKDDAGNVVLSNGETMLYESAKNVIAVDNPDRLTVVQGINDCIIAESGNVLLICKMGNEQRIKQFVADAQMKYGKRFK